MRICHSDVRLVSAFMNAQAEAELAFGDSQIYMEKFLERPRHIEVQIAADNYGNVIHLGERDCSIQRRHQKLIEEAPSPALNNKLRANLGEMVSKVIKDIHYTSVGTVEFLLDNEHFYFIEMNTRIQVEHPVTEEITGVDLVKLQISMAAGEKLKIKQNEISFEGTAIECRINAEDPENNFIPSAGRIEFCYFPGGKDVRVDTHVYAGYTVPPNYDSLIAKIIAKGKTRKETLQKMDRALGELLIEPNKTTVSFCRKIINDSDFRRGIYNTDFLKKFISREEE